MGLTLAQYRNIIDLVPYDRPQLLEEDEREEACGKLLKFLLKERGLIAAFSAAYDKKRELVRRYMNVRNPVPVPAEILQLQDRLFWTESVMRGIVNVAELPENDYGIATWEGDICRLDADAVVNAANKSLLGCFLAGHHCIDNAIHSFAGMQLRDDCAKIMAQQGQEEECGDAKITRAYNLPSKYVLHTVGPMIAHEVSDIQRGQLKSSYLSCLDLAAETGLKSVAFCCISTGVFNFPREEAAEIATGAVLNWKLRHPKVTMKVVFNTYLKEDTAVYRAILSRM